MATRKLSGTYAFSVVGTSLEKLLGGNSSRYQNGIRSLAYSPDGKWLIAGTRMGQLCRWDTSAAKPAPVLWQAHEPTEGVNALTFAPDGSYLISTSNLSAMRWDVAQEWKGTPFTESHALQACFSGDGAVLALTTRAGLRLLSHGEREPRKTIPD